MQMEEIEKEKMKSYDYYNTEEKNTTFICVGAPQANIQPFALCTTLLLREP
jgi:hypothetical protein